MKYAIIGIPTVQYEWTKAEYAHLHILEHLLCLGRGDQVMEEYDTFFSQYWCQFMGTQRKNSIMLETEVLTGYEYKFQNKLSEAWSEPNWDYFINEKKMVLDEVKNNSNIFHKISEAESANLNFPYNNFYVGGTVSDVEKTTLQDVQAVWNIVKNIHYYKLESDQKAFHINSEFAKASFKKKLKVIYNPANKNIILQLYFTEYFSIAALWLLNKYLFDNWSTESTSRVQILPGTTFVTISFINETEHSKDETSEIIYSKAKKIVSEPLPAEATEFEFNLLESSDRNRLLEIWDKEIYKNYK